VGLDVDYRGDQGDFKNRCGQVRKALRILRIPKKGILTQSTPSGGRHYRFFLTRHVRVQDISYVLGLIGIHHQPGKFEIFPSMTQGMRLPFGAMPNRQAAPQRWVQFIRDFREGRIRKVPWIHILKRVDAYAQRRNELLGGEMAQQSPATAKDDSRPFSSPKAQTDRPAALKAFSSEMAIPRRSVEARTEYDRLLSSPWKSAADGLALWNLGIQKAGTRVLATKRLAYHLLHVRGMSLSEAQTCLVEWVYRSGATKSSDVRADLEKGTRRVEKQTEQIVEWTSNLNPPKRTSAGKPRFAVDELESIYERLSLLPEEVRADRFLFALRLLDFTRRHGSSNGEGYECPVGVRGIFRSWPGCSGMRYKAKRDDLERIGLIRMTREKRQRSNKYGRPRTYLITVGQPSVPRSLDFPQAEAWFAQRKSNCSQAQGERLNPECESDTYGTNVPLSPEMEQSGVIGEAPLRPDSSHERGDVDHSLPGENQIPPQSVVIPKREHAKRFAEQFASFVQRNSRNKGFSSTVSPLESNSCNAGNPPCLIADSGNGPMNRNEVVERAESLGGNLKVSFPYPKQRPGFGLPQRFRRPWSRPLVQSHPLEGEGKINPPRADEEMTFNKALPQGSPPCHSSLPRSLYGEVWNFNDGQSPFIGRGPAPTAPQSSTSDLRGTLHSPPRHGKPLSDAFPTLPETLPGGSPSD